MQAAAAPWLVQAAAPRRLACSLPASRGRSLDAGGRIVGCTTSVPARLSAVLDRLVGGPQLLLARAACRQRPYLLIVDGDLELLLARRHRLGLLLAEDGLLHAGPDVHDAATLLVHGVPAAVEKGGGESINLFETLSIGLKIVRSPCFKTG